MLQTATDSTQQIAPEFTVYARRQAEDILQTQGRDGARLVTRGGLKIVTNRQVGLCLLCHSGPYPQERFQGTMAPDLKGAGSRWSEGQLRLRIVDAARVTPQTIMPPYYRADGVTRVAAGFRGKPILTAEQIEDVVAYLVTLKD